jgi:maltose phosphorylase
MTVVQGFGGMRIKDGMLSFNAVLPEKWNSYSFQIRHKDNVLKVEVSKSGTHIDRLEGAETQVIVNGKIIKV